MTNLDIAQITLECWGAVFSAIAALMMSFSVARHKRSSSVIQWLFLVNMNNLIADACAYIFRGKLDKFSLFMTRFCNFIMMFTMYLMVILAAHYIFCLLRENGGVVHKPMLYAIGIIEAIPIIITVVNLFNGCMYYFDEYNMYHRGRIYNGTMGIVLLGMYLCLVVTIANRKKIGIFTATATCIYLLIPVVLMMIQLFYYGLSLVNLGATIALMLVLLAYQKEQGMKYRKKQFALSDSRSGLLLGQIKPDFIEDTLKSIEDYCVVDSLKARKMIQDLSGYMKNTFFFMEKEELIPFEKEMEIVDLYLSLEEARNIKVQVQKIIEVTDFMVPPLSIEPLVENALRHGMNSGKEQGHIVIKSFEEDQHYVVVIFDDGVGFDQKALEDNPSEMIGIQSIKDRVKYLSKGTLEIESEVGEGTAVAVRIPKKKNK